MARRLLALLLAVTLITETQCKTDTEHVTTTVHNTLIRRRMIAKRAINCTKEEFHSDGQCCKKCKRGFVKTIKCPTDAQQHCRKCEEGKEYIDHSNDHEECLRCTACDRILGLVVGRNCTSEQDTECICAENHFCNSTPCQHCHPCTTCESGVIERQCTSTSDTVCGTEGFPPWATALLIVFPVLVSGIAGSIIYYKARQKGFTNKGNLAEVASEADPPSESIPLVTYTGERQVISLNSVEVKNTDIDLSSHVTGIVEEMTLQEVLKFVRNHQVPEPVIDQTLRDNMNDTSEQKIKLFRVWHQRHGIKGAYGTLISSLRELKMCAVADKIEGKLKAAVPSRQEGGQSCSDDPEQSQPCTQGNRNSDTDSTELNKTFSGLLEET